MRHPLGSRTRIVRVHVTVPPHTVRPEYAPSFGLLQVEGREVVFRRADDTLVFGRIVGPYELKRWGCSTPETVDPADVMSICVVERARWTSVQTIAKAQAHGWRITGITGSKGVGKAAIEEPIR